MLTSYDSLTPTSLNTPCGAGCLSTSVRASNAGIGVVSIHRVVLGAYRPYQHRQRGAQNPSQYTVWCWVLIDRNKDRRGAYRDVSIHRVVLGAYRLVCGPTNCRPVASLNTPCGAGCLSTRTRLTPIRSTRSQYTVWCWVLIDSHLYKPHHNAAYSTVVATGDSRTPTRQ